MVRNCIISSSVDQYISLTSALNFKSCRSLYIYICLSVAIPKDDVIKAMKSHLDQDVNKNTFLDFYINMVKSVILSCWSLLPLPIGCKLHFLCPPLLEHSAPLRSPFFLTFFPSIFRFLQSSRVFEEFFCTQVSTFSISFFLSFSKF